MELAGEGRHRRIQFSDDSDSDDGGASRVVLTQAKASEKCPVPHRLLARSGAFTHLDDLTILSSLDYVDLTDNSLTDLTGLATLPRLKTLIARGNLVTSAAAAAALSAIPTLRVLNLAENALADTDWLARAAFAPHLEALVINGNRVAVLDGVAALARLETLIVSHNEVEDLGVVRSLPLLKKLSASYNRLRALPPAITTCGGLGELRIAHNRIAALPDTSVLSRLSGLRILDVGHNRITSLDGLQLLTAVEQVNVAENPVSKDAEACRKVLLTMCAGVQIVDGTRIAGGRRKLRMKREWKERRAGRPRAWGPDAHPAAAGGVLDEDVGKGGTERGGVDDGAAEGAARRAAKRARLPPAEQPGAAAAVGEGRVAEAVGDGENDDAIDATEFVARGREASGESRKKRKKAKALAAVVDAGTTTVEAFGTGGTSAWD